jgi:hypothetical protein
MTNLIISTGDISDVDGFFALAEYAKTGADVVFIMNYPAYLQDIEIENEIGLGYSYGSSLLLFEIKKKLTNLAFFISKNVWDEVSNKNKGSLYFYIGGVNSINPFSAKSIKNEIELYKSIYENNNYFKSINIKIEEGIIYDLSLAEVKLDYNNYSDIYIDFNGSMAFFTEDWLLLFESLSTVNKIKGIFIMGGVYANGSPPLTMPSIPNVLNRLSCSTMNQLYHPENTAKFFNFIKGTNIPAYIVTNNIVLPFKDNNFIRFLENNGLNYDFLKNIATIYYGSKYNPPKKPFDFYTAKLLCSVLRGEIVKKKKLNYLFYDNKYGMTFVSESNIWKIVKGFYITGLNTKIKGLNNGSIKNNYKNEIQLISQIEDLSFIPVFDASFTKNNKNILSISIDNSRNRPNLLGGEKRINLKKTDEKIKIGKNNRFIYINQNGTKHIKIKGEFIKISKIQK